MVPARQLFFSAFYLCPGVVNVPSLNVDQTAEGDIKAVTIF